MAERLLLRVEFYTSSINLRTIAKERINKEVSMS